MQINKINRTTIGTDCAMEQTHPDNRRGRLIAPTADLSALSGFFHVWIISLMCIIVPTADLSAPLEISPTADYAVSKRQVNDQRSQSSVLAGLLIGPSSVTLSRSEGSLINLLNLIISPTPLLRQRRRIPFFEHP
jgi:hypothetical protein